MENIPFLLLEGLMLGAFFVVSFASQKFRLPSVLLYIVLGVAASSLFLKSEVLHMAAEIGIVLLFFILGLEFPLTRMVGLSRRIWPSGLLDVVLNLGGGMGIGLLFGLDAISAFTVGSIAYATSSSISAKMLDEKKRLANSETEFILALLIFEDLVAPVVVSFIASVHGDETLSLGFMALLMLKIIVLTTGAILMGHFGFKYLSSFVARHIESDFMPLMAVGVALAYAGLGITLGLSEILGAFMAGVMLSETGKSSEIEHLLLPIRDLTLPFFFFWFGTTIHLGEGVPFIAMMAALTLFAIGGKVITGYMGSKWFGLSPKVAIRAGFSMVHRGEFSAIIASLAPPLLRVFSGVYILITAFIGVYLFGKAPQIANWYQKRCLDRPTRATVKQERES